MSSDLYVKSLARGSMRVRRHSHISGEVVISFTDPNVKPIHIVDNNIIDLIDGKVITAYLVQRSNVRKLVARRFLEVVM